MLKMANKIPNRQAICDALCACAETDQEIIVLCSDSRGSASMTAFANTFPKQFVEVGIAEQNLVSISAGLASCGKKPFAFSPASFLSARSYEQIKVDCAYSNTNVKLVGISGGVSYGALGMSHHSVQDIAAISAIPNMRVYLPSDRHQSAWLVKELLKDQKPAYIRIGRNAVEDVYAEETIFSLDRAVILQGNDQPVDAALIACGEMVHPAKQAAALLEECGISASVIDMYCLKPIDENTIILAAKQAKLVVSIEEHAPSGGLGAMVAQIVSEHCPRKVKNLTLPDAPVITGTSTEVFRHYGLDAKGIADTVQMLLEEMNICKN